MPQVIPSLFCTHVFQTSDFLCSQKAAVSEIWAKQEDLLVSQLWRPLGRLTPESRQFEKDTLSVPTAPGGSAGQCPLLETRAHQRDAAPRFLCLERRGGRSPPSRGMGARPIHRDRQSELHLHAPLFVSLQPLRTSPHTIFQGQVLIFSLNIKSTLKKKWRLINKAHPPPLLLQ